MAFRRLQQKLLLIKAVQELIDDDDLIGILADSVEEYKTEVLCRYLEVGDKRNGVIRRAWKLYRNDSNWLYDYALTPYYSGNAQRRSDFRVPLGIYQKLCSEPCNSLEKGVTPTRPSLTASLVIAAYLMWTGGKGYTEITEM